MKAPSLLDPDYRYTPADKTDIRKTFARVRAMIAFRAAHAPGGPFPTLGIVQDEPRIAHCPVTFKPCGDRKASGEWRCSREHECVTNIELVDDITLPSGPAVLRVVKP